MKSVRFYFAICIALFCGLNSSRAEDTNTPFVGYWALHVPGVNAAWLGVQPKGSRLVAQMMWEGGSVFGLDTAHVQDGKLVLRWAHRNESKKTDGQKFIRQRVQTITGTLDGDSIKFDSVFTNFDDKVEHIEFTGKRLPPMPPAPDLSALKLGDPIQLFNGKDLDGWRPVETDAINGWGVADGILYNKQGEEDKSYANLRTVAEFNDFTLHAEVRVPKNGNSGIYLRGIYEVQVFDSYGKPADSHNMGAVYSRIKPTKTVEKPAGQWQTLDITFVQRHATVVLNGTKIIDNQPVLGPTGGALWSEVDRPGPIYLQGDHTGMEYRNIVLRPVLD